MRIQKKLILIALALLAAASIAYAQSKVTIIIQSNTAGAQVYINDNLAGATSPNVTLQVFPGRYTIRVVKSGYIDFRTEVSAVQGPVVVIANLQKATPQIPSPSPSSPSMPPTNPSLPPPNLTPAPPTGRLIIESGISGASVFINGAYAGSTPFQSMLPRGSYLIRVAAPGYADTAEQVFVDDYTRLSIPLSPLPVEYELRLPLIAPNHPGQGNSHDRLDLGEMQVFIDGNRVDRLRGRIVPGKHTLTLIYRQLRLEGEFVVVPGRSATIELSLGLKVY